MICGAQVELNFSQRGWDQLFEIPGENGDMVEDPTQIYTRKMSYIDMERCQTENSPINEDNHATCTK